MKYLSHICAFIFLLCVSMTCDGDFYYPVEVNGFSLTHMDNSGVTPMELFDEDELKKEAYVLKVQLNVKDEHHEEGFEPDYECRLVDPIYGIKVFSYLQVENEPVFEEVTQNFKNYQIIDPSYACNISPIPMNSLEFLKNSTIYMALLDIPDPGEYQYKVVITLNSGKEFSQITEPIVLY